MKRISSDASQAPAADEIQNVCRAPAPPVVRAGSSPDYSWRHLVGGQLLPEGVARMTRG